MKIRCYSCANFFDCGFDDPQFACWCADKTSVAVDCNKKQCLCESCLELKINFQQGAPSCFRLWVAYVGTHFCGFQAQGSLRTVEQELVTALTTITKGAVSITVAGRTDAGVHARGQVVSCRLFTSMSPRQLTLAMASILPPDISVWRVDKMPINFDARRQSIGKYYRYRIHQGITADPFIRSHSLFVRSSLDLEHMKEAARYFVGEHDFSGFRSSQCTARHARRFVWDVAIDSNRNNIVIDVRGNAFCLNMVRIMVGTLIEVGKNRRDAQSIKDALDSGKRTNAGITAKACGLSLEQVYYPDDLSGSRIPKDARFPRYPVTDESWGIERSKIVYGPTK